MTVTIQGLGFAYDLEAHFTGGTDHSLTIRDVVIVQPDAIDSAITMTTSVPSSLSVIGSYIQLKSGGIDIVASNPSGLFTFLAVGNRISASGETASGPGIYLETHQSGSVRADILDNAIWDVASCGCGVAGGIAIDALGTTHTTANLVGNTVDHVVVESNVTVPAMAIYDGVTSGGYVSVDAFNNVLAHSNDGLVIEDGANSPKAFLTAGYNDFYKNQFGNRLDGQSLGTHDLSKNPAFADESSGDLRLKASSPLIDKGLVCSPGGVANLDAAGHGRLHGASVDMGAYERGAGAPTGVALVGTSGVDHLNGTAGADILCGYGGNDVLNGKGGNDYLDGGAGSDVITGGTGNDLLFGEAGNDTLCARDGIHGNDHLDGGPGTDGYRADSGDHLAGVEHTATC